MLLLLLGAGAVRERARSASRRFDRIEEGKLAIASSRIHVLEAAEAANHEGSILAAVEEARNDGPILRAVTKGNGPQEALGERLERSLARALAAVGSGERLNVSEALTTLEEMSREEDARLASAERDRLHARTAWQFVLGLAVVGVVAFVSGALRRLERRRRELSNQSALLSSILESMGDALVAVDSDQRVLVANAAARRVFAHLAVGDPLTTTSHLLTAVGHRVQASDTPLARALHERQASLRKARRPSPMVRCDGSPRP